MDFFKVPHGHIKALKSHMKRRLATPNCQPPLLDSSCCHRKVYTDQ